MRALAAAACLALAGCIPASLERLESTGTTTTHSTTLPWQDAYRRLNDRLQACANLAWAGGTDGQLYTERGEIVVRYQRGPFTSGTGPLLQVEVTPAPQGATVTATHAPLLLGRQLAARITPWLAGETACR